MLFGAGGSPDETSTELILGWEFSAVLVQMCREFKVSASKLPVLLSKTRFNPSYE
jgi:hypothetical protein